MEVNDILKMRNGCIQGEPAYCTATCPLHVDVRGMIKYLQAGDFTRAYKLYAKQVLFPVILSRICDEPCKDACIRNKLDESVSIRLLEKASVDFASKRILPAYYVSEKQNTITVIGGGLCGLSCALDLSRKGYHVKLFEMSSRLGGRLWELEETIMPRQVLLQEFEKTIEENITLHFNSEITSIDVLERDALFIATGNSGVDFGINRSAVDPLTLATNLKGVFAGGDILNTNGMISPVRLMAQGLQASKSIERYLKQSSLSLGREDELKTETQLYTNIAGASKTNVVLPADTTGGYTEREAKEEALRCLLCECMECVKNCTYLAEYKSYPEVYIKSFGGMMLGTAGFEKKNYMHQLNSCSMCGLCKEVCPNSVDMGKVVKKCKEFFYGKDTMPRAFHDYMLRDMDFSGSDDAFLSFGQPGFQKCRYLFFPGCQLGASDPEYVQLSYRYLTERLDGGVGIYIDCCGAPAAWAGNSAAFQTKQASFLEYWRGMGRPVVLAACPSCSKMFEAYSTEIQTSSIWTILKSFGLPENIPSSEGIPIAVYDPCASRYFPEMQSDVRDLLDAMGYRSEELQLHNRFARCCSYGGAISQVNPALAEKIIHDRVDASPLPYVTYCSNCRDDFADKGKPTWHLLDILFGRNDTSHALRTPPTKSQRRSNRVKLKALLVAEWCGLELKREQNAFNSMNVMIPDELIKKADKRFILTDDIKQVIWRAEKSGYKFVRPKSGLITAHLKIGMITYWVEYRSVENIYTVTNVYSHRMELQENFDG